MKCPVRLCIGIQIFMSVFMVYVLRTTMSMNILAMVKPIKTDNANASQSECIISSNNKTNETAPVPNYGPRYEWSRAQQGFVLGAYFYGYLIMCGPGGYVADKFGATRITFYSTVVGAVLTAVIPLCAVASVWAVVVARFLIGLTGGVVYPAVQSLISRWAPPAEKGKFVAALMGNTLGTCLTLPILGALIDKIGWLWAFILPAIVSLVWAFLWYFTVADSPAEHKWISEEETTYINEKLGTNVKRVKKIPPYIKMFLNIPFWALSILHFGNLWCLFLLLINGPMYMKEALGFDIKNSGILSALPYLARLLFGIVFGMIGDYIKKRELLSVQFTRKFFCLFSHIIPGLLMLSVLLADCNATFAVTVIILSLGFNGACTLTNLQNCQDLAPNFAGTLYGLVNVLGSLAGPLVPQVVSIITSKRSGIHEWNIIFALSASLYIGCALIYLAIGSAKVQSFNDIPEES